MALECPSCGAPNDDAARFCSSCGTRLARTCPACGASVELRARFCPECGTRLGDDAPAPPAPSEERRLVTIVFADLAGFTQRSDRADPEDVRRILLPFHELAKEEIERFGGTLDKFIGDAAMGVFGAPIAHEDDAERAVRAALAIRERVSAMQMPVRVAVNTGEAIVTFATGPQVGENVAGDVVNTASRLQGVAPVGGVVVGETTERATRGIVAFDAMEPVSVKGKAEPIAVWLAGSLQRAIPERDEDDPPPFVGRERERLALRDLLARIERDRCVHLVTIVGEPGIGKSRLVADLGDHVRGREEPVAWFRGRCQPYGESITFAALEEVVRAAIGVEPSDDHRTVASKLHAALDGLALGADDRTWLSGRLAPLVGLGDTVADATASRDELFTAWIRFLEAEALRRPIVLVIEDLHWADEPMLAFLSTLTDAGADVSLLVVATTRPELFSDHPSWGAKPDATVISLAPLSEGEMQDLLGSLLVRSVLPPDVRAGLMDRAGGNPLYAREFVHMLEDRGITRDMRGARVGDAVSVPDTVQGIIAARLDALTPPQRSLVHQASVIGDRFWPGALAALDPTAIEVDASLRELQRRGMIRRLASSTIDGEQEFGFAHGLIRDVAYGQLPRGVRAQGHLRASEWLEDGTTSRAPDLPDLLAYHATRALDLARAAGLDEDVPALEERALRLLVRAAERQTALDAGQAADYYARALDLAPADGHGRAELLRLATSLAWRAGKVTSDQAVTAYREALQLALDDGDRESAGKVMRRLYAQLSLQGDTTEAQEILDRAVDLMEEVDEPGPVLANLYACRSEVEMFAGRSDESLRWAERALSIPRTDDTTLMALHLRGNALCEVGDERGLEDLREAVRVAREGGEGMQVATSLSYLAEWVGWNEGPAAALVMNDEGVAMSQSRGLEPQEMWGRAERLWPLFDAGRWDEILVEADALEDWAEHHGDTQVSSVAATYVGRVLAHRRSFTQARKAMERFLPLARQIEDLQVLAPALSVGAMIEAGTGDPVATLELIHEFDSITAEAPAEYREIQLPEAVEAAVLAGGSEEGARLLSDRPLYTPRTRLAVDACRARLVEAEGAYVEAAGRYATLADAWERWGGLPERAYALAGRVRCLERLGEDARLDRARAEDLFARLGIAASTIL